MTTYTKIGRGIFVASSLWACGLSLIVWAGESKESPAGVPPIFAPPVAGDKTSPSAASAPTPVPPGSPSTETIHRQVSEGLPKFDSKGAGPEGSVPDSTAIAGAAAPIQMDRFTVYDARVLELMKPSESLLERISRAEPLFRYKGKKYTSELTFVDLASASNWKPFSIDPPPAVSLRFTISW
jgi:hypothetical protein